MSLVTESDITVNGIDYDVEHFVDGNIERIIVWGKPERLIADAFVDHNAESITVHFHTEDEKRTESYDYWEFAGEEDKEVAVNILALWMGTVV